MLSVSDGFYWRNVNDCVGLCTAYVRDIVATSSRMGSYVSHADATSVISHGLVCVHLPDPPMHSVLVSGFSASLHIWPRTIESTNHTGTHTHTHTMLHKTKCEILLPLTNCRNIYSCESDICANDKWRRSTLPCRKLRRCVIAVFTKSIKSIDSNCLAEN